jgi:glycosyltransferase involved in cell wall biosynthesis
MREQVLESELCRPPAAASVQTVLVVIWIDWYAYHLARFQALLQNADLAGTVVGIEMVGGIGVHSGLKFREILPAGLPIHTLVPNGNWADTGKWHLSRLLWKNLNLIGPSVVLIPGYYTVPALAAAVWCKLKGRKAVLMTESGVQDHKRLWWREAFKQWLILSLFDWAVAGGTAHTDYLQQLQFPSGRVARFYDVVDNSFFQSQCRTLRVLQSASDFGLPAKYFLYVGRVSQEKNTRALLNAFLNYRAAGGTWALVVVGDGPQLSELHCASAHSLYESNVYFTGLQATSQLPKYYAFASVFVLPSIREPWGLVVNEAMAAGLPVLVSNRCGCAADLVASGENGFTFDPFDEPALADALTRMEKLGERNLKQMGQRSSEIISRFSPEAWAAEIARIVRS